MTVTVRHRVVVVVVVVVEAGYPFPKSRKKKRRFLRDFWPSAFWKERLSYSNSKSLLSGKFLDFSQPSFTTFIQNDVKEMRMKMSPFPIVIIGILLKVFPARFEGFNRLHQVLLLCNLMRGRMHIAMLLCMSTSIRCFCLQTRLLSAP